MERKKSDSLYQDNDERFFSVTCKGLKKRNPKYNYTLRVSYDNLSKTIQHLHQQGATITNIALISSSLSINNKSNFLSRKSSSKEIKKVLSSLPLTRKLGLKKRKLSRFSSHTRRRDKSRLKHLRHKRKSKHK